MGQKIERKVTSYLARPIVYGDPARQRRTTADVVPLGQFAEFLAGLHARSPPPEPSPLIHSRGKPVGRLGVWVWI